MKTGSAKTTHTFPYKEFPWARSDNQQLYNSVLCNHVPNCQIFTVRLSLKPRMCVGTVNCESNTKTFLFQHSVMCSGGWKHSRVHPIKRLPLVCVWFWVTMRTMELEWQWRPLVTTGRTHSGRPMNYTQVPTRECFLIPQGSLKTQAKLRCGLGNSSRWFLQMGIQGIWIICEFLFLQNLAYTYKCSNKAFVASIFP